MMTTVLEKPQETQREAAGTREFLWTTELFYQALEAGVFKEPNLLELIHGRIIQKMPQSPLHRAYRVSIGRYLREGFSSPYQVVDECPIHLAFDGEPIPDIVVLRGREAENQLRHPIPDEIVLLIEVSVTSIDYDLGEKALLYAQAGVEEYWVVLPEARQVWVHREPSPEGYRSIIGLGETEAICPLAAPEMDLTVHQFLGTAVKP